MKEKIAIVGAGIAGLACAIALKRLGYQVEVFEAYDEMNPVGAGIALTYNALEALKVLGIEEEAFSDSFHLGDFSIRDAKGKWISTIPFGKISTALGSRTLVLHRAVLHQILASRVDTVHLGAKVTEVRAINRGYELCLKGRQERVFDAVIGADGIHSAVRVGVTSKTRLRSAGYVCWRAVSNNRFGLKQGFETWDTKGRVGMMPINQQQIYWFICINGRDLSNWTLEDLADRFKKYHSPIPEILKSTKREEVIYNAIDDLNEVTAFSNGKVLLIGDAAHAMTPNMGQGACQALEDVAALYQLLQKEPNIKMAFKRFEKIRLKRTNKILKLSRMAGIIAQIDNPTLTCLRNNIMRTLPEKWRRKQLLKILTAIDFVPVEPR